MRGWWQCPSGLGSDVRWRALSLAARGLLATLADAADGTGEVVTGRVPLATVLRGMAPGETAEAREALWSELTAAELVEVDGPVILVTLPCGAVVARGEAVRGDDAAERVEAAAEAQGGAQEARDTMAALRALFSRRGMKTAEAKLAWLATDEGVATLARLDVDPAAARAMAERTGRNPGRFGDGRTHGRTRATVTAERRPNACDRDGRTTAERTPSPSHSPSGEKEKEKEGLGAHETPAEDGRTPVERTDARDGDDGRTRTTVTAERTAERTYDRDGVETALVSASGGKVDLISAPAHMLRDLHRVMGEMRVTPALARVMGELARDPAAVWKRATPVRRVTPQFLLGWVEGNGERDARALSELVAAAREKVAATRALRAVPPPAAWSEPQPTEEEREAFRVRAGLFVEKMKANKRARELEATLAADRALEEAAAAARRKVGQA